MFRNAASMEKGQKPKRNKVVAAAWLTVGLAVVVAVSGILRLLLEPKDKFSLPNLSALGSFLGGSVAPLLSLAALLFVYAAFREQQNQLAAQEQESKQQSTQFQTQQESIQRQSFENAFFNLMQLHNDIAMNLRPAPCPLFKFDSESSIPRGKECFQAWYKYLCRLMLELPRLEGQTKQDSILQESYRRLYNSQQSQLAHYFRNLYHLFKFVKDSEMSYERKRHYTDLARAQLSAYELAFLFYHGLTPMSHETRMTFKELIEDFGLLHNLETRILVYKWHTTFYSKSAYE